MESLHKIDILASRKLACVHSNVKIADVLSIAKRINKLAAFFDVIPREVLAEYKQQFEEHPRYLDNK